MTAEVEKVLMKIGVIASKPALTLVTIIFGLGVILFPHLLQWITGIYFIIQGLFLLVDIT